MKVWVLIPLTDDTGFHKPGDELDLPEDTVDEENYLQTLLAYGIVTWEQPYVEKSDGSTD